MPRVATAGISRHKSKGFRIEIGKKADGKYRTFWLGHDRAVAEYGAEMYRRCWYHMQCTGIPYWTPSHEKMMLDHIEFYAEAIRVRLPAMYAADLERTEQERKAVEGRQRMLPELAGDGHGPATPVLMRPSDAPERRAVPGLHAAIDQYVASLQGKAGSDSHRERTQQLMGDLKHWREDVPLTQIDRVWLQKLTDFLKGRPLSRRRHKPLAPNTVRNTLRAWKGFFGWVDANAEGELFGGWTAPRRFEELFKVRVASIMTKAERDRAADGPEHLTPEQVVRVYRAAKSDLHRICIGLGVFAALGQQEIATLRREEFDLDAGHLRHRRSKTSQLGQYWLPPELIELIRGYFRANRRRPGGLAFVTADGKPLVSRKSDSVRQAWSDVVGRANRKSPVPAERITQGFYSLRKFNADFAMRRGGPVLRDTVLAHAPASVGDKHYSNTRDFDAVFEAGRALHAELSSLGMFTATAKCEDSAAKGPTSNDIS